MSRLEDDNIEGLLMILVSVTQTKSHNVLQHVTMNKVIFHCGVSFLFVYLRHRRHRRRRHRLLLLSAAAAADAAFVT